MCVWFRRWCICRNYSHKQQSSPNCSVVPFPGSGLSAFSKLHVRCVITRPQLLNFLRDQGTLNGSLKAILEYHLNLESLMPQFYFAFPSAPPLFTHLSPDLIHCIFPSFRSTLRTQRYSKFKVWPCVDHFNSRYLSTFIHEGIFANGSFELFGDLVCYAWHRGWKHK